MQIFASDVDEFHAEYLQLLMMKEIISIHDLLQVLVKSSMDFLQVWNIITWIVYKCWSEEVFHGKIVVMNQEVSDLLLQDLVDGIFMLQMWAAR